jgi:hypothetical protein
MTPGRHQCDAGRFLNPNTKHTKVHKCIKKNWTKKFAKIGLSTTGGGGFFSGYCFISQIFLIANAFRAKPRRDIANKLIRSSVWQKLNDSSNNIFSLIHDRRFCSKPYKSFPCQKALKVLTTKDFKKRNIFF